MAETKVPLKLRKQMLLMRAAVERIELAQHVLDVKQAATISAVFRNALPRSSSGPRSFAMRAFDMVKRYPFLASAASLIASRFKLPLFKIATKVGGAATVGYKLYDLWQQKKRPPARIPVSRRITLD